MNKAALSILFNLLDEYADIQNPTPEQIEAYETISKSLLGIILERA